MSPNQLDEEAERWCGCITIGVGGDGCCAAQTSAGEAVRSALLLVALAGLSLLTWLALHLQNRMDTTQRIITTGMLLLYRVQGNITQGNCMTVSLPQLCCLYPRGRVVVCGGGSDNILLCFQAFPVSLYW